MVSMTDNLLSNLFSFSRYMALYTPPPLLIPSATQPQEKDVDSIVVPNKSLRFLSLYMVIILHTFETLHSYDFSYKKGGVVTEDKDLHTN
jgi:hypothetical protein